MSTESALWPISASFGSDTFIYPIGIHRGDKSRFIVVCETDFIIIFLLLYYVLYEQL